MRDEYFDALVPLADANPMLNTRMEERIAERFLRGAGLDERRRDEAIAQIQIHTGTGQAGVVWLVVTLPLGSGHPGFEWDGTERQALEIADHAAERGIEDVRWDQEHIGPTGWEADHD